MTISSKISAITIQIMDRIKKEREAQGISQEGLAVMCGWGKNNGGRVSNYERCVREPSLSDLRIMGEKLGITLENLLFEKSYFCSKWVEVPILRMDQLKHPYDHNNNEGVYMLVAYSDPSSRLVGVKVEGDAMESPSNIARSLCDGDIALFELLENTDKKPKPKDLVLASVCGVEKIREYATDGAETFLKAYNPAYPAIQINQDVEILGIVVRKERSLN